MVTNRNPLPAEPCDNVHKVESVLGYNWGPEGMIICTARICHGDYGKRGLPSLVAIKVNSLAITKILPVQKRYQLNY